MEFIMPCFACVIIIYALIKRVSVFDVFLKGAREGISLICSIAPTIIGLVFAVDLLRSSGATEQLCRLVEPLARAVGFPEEIVPLVLLRPVSGSASSALLVSVYEECGADSFAGRVASVLAGSSETTFYAVAVYFGSIKLKKIRHTLVAALAADAAAAVMSVLTVRLFFGM